MHLWDDNSQMSKGLIIDEPVLVVAAIKKGWKVYIPMTKCTLESCKAQRQVATKDMACFPKDNEEFMDPKKFVEAWGRFLALLKKYFPDKQKGKELHKLWKKHTEVFSANADFWDCPQAYIMSQLVAGTEMESLLVLS